MCWKAKGKREQKFQPSETSPSLPPSLSTQQQILKIHQFISVLKLKYAPQVKEAPIKFMAILYFYMFLAALAALYLPCFLTDLLTDSLMILDFEPFRSNHTKPT